MPVRLRFFAPLLVVLTSACANTSTLVTRHQPAAGEAPLAALLLVANTPDNDRRRAWERACAEQLPASLQLHYSHRLWPQGVPETETLLQHTAGLGAAALMTADVAGLLLLPPQMPAENVISEERRASSDASPRSPGFQITLAGAAPEQDGLPDPDVEFQLQRADGRVIWNALVRSHEANQIEAIARSQCRRVTKALGRTGLLP